MDEVTRSETATGWYESTRRVPRPELRPFVSAYWGLRGALARPGAPPRGPLPGRDRNDRLRGRRPHRARRRRPRGQPAPPFLGRRVDDLAGQIGWSRKRLGVAFREHVGLPPKVVARVLRFGRAVSLLRVHDRPEWGEIAHRCGYYDQAHFNRDFREFAGVTPTEFARRLSPNDPGVAA